MSKVRLDMSMSMDGLSTGPDDDLELLHDWLLRDSSPGTVNGKVLAEFFANTGAYVIGRRTFDMGLEPWGDEPPFGNPSFVVTHESRDPLVKGATTFTFVNGVESAVKQARQAAGDRDVTVIGGADIARQCVRAGLLDELDIHVVPLLLGDGIRLFDQLAIKPTVLERVRLIDGGHVIHLRYRFQP